MTTKSKATGGFTERERAAMKARAAELKKESDRGRGKRKAADELEVLSKIQGMDDSDRALGERVHAIVTEVAPELTPKLWYGQPAYAMNGKVVCFFRSGSDDGERYSSFGFTPEANLDDDSGLWATSYALADVTEKSADAIAELVRRAVS